MPPGWSTEGALAAYAAVLADARARRGVYLGALPDRTLWAPPERSVLVLGPPRSGKSSCLVVPGVMSAAGSVVSTSTKPDVLAATAGPRSRLGPCLLYDPSGTVATPPGVQRLQWSPVPASRRWDTAVLLSHEMVQAAHDARPGRNAESHWTERAQALLAPLLHAAAIDGETMSTLLRWVDRRSASRAIDILDRNGATRAADLLGGIADTDPRELSGIWSTASGVLAGYRTDAALASTQGPTFDPARFCDARATLYICASGQQQALVAPLVVGLIGQIRDAGYARSASDPAAARGSPLLLALDEVANIAPMSALPKMASEGGGQGVLTMACLQDLSQARARWGVEAEGFFSLFGTKVVLPGIEDVRTLQAISTVAGDVDVVTSSLTRPSRSSSALAFAGTFFGALGGRGWSMQAGGAASSTTSTTRRPRLPPDAISRGRDGEALVIDERSMTWSVGLTPWFSNEPWRSVAGIGIERGLAMGGPARLDRSLPPGPVLGLG